VDIVPTPNSTKTLNDVVIWVKRQFGDESGVQVTDSDIIRWTNQAQMEVVNKTPIIQATAITQSVIGTQTYAIPPDMIQLESIMFDGNILQPNNFEGIRSELGDDNNVSGTPMYWYLWANQIYLWPIPSTVKSISVNYSKTPTNVSGLADKLGLPDRYFDRVCEYVLSKAYEMDEDWPATQSTRKQFEDKLNETTNSDRNMVGSWFIAMDYEYEGG
jgi:hypothetical protein